MHQPRHSKIMEYKLSNPYWLWRCRMPPPQPGFYPPQPGFYPSPLPMYHQPHQYSPNHYGFPQYANPHPYQPYWNNAGGYQTPTQQMQLPFQMAKVLLALMEA
ncbi:hypothetical protein LTR42_006485 [Elasticomyces elasticus]|nr:hypothetical protein LTR42_006485 [Elasticomyces elasticus]